MATDRKTYTKEFKLEVLQMLESTPKSQAQLDRELGIGQVHENELCDIGIWHYPSIASIRSEILRPASASHSLLDRLA